MKLTAQAEYGIRCILSVARQACGEQVDPESPRSLTINEIAEREGLSLEYAGKLLRLLRRGGVVDSVLGRRGGYRLSRPAEEISVRAVLDALDGRIYRDEFCERYPGDRASCVHDRDCALRSLWAGLQLIIDDVLSRVTLRELVDNEQAMARRIRDHAPHVTFPRILRRRRGRES